MRRAALVCMLGIALACGANDDAVQGDSAMNPPPETPPPPANETACGVDADCVPAASTCCACPTFAVPVDSDWPRACEIVPCDPGTICPQQEPRCVSGACQLVCAEIACTASCAGGFAVDAAGCLTCACRAEAPPACGEDADCARVPADCCGCARGGADIAVAASEVETHQRELACGADVRCPGVDVCPAVAEPACRDGRCLLTDGEDDAPLPGDACGRPDLPPCPSGARCWLNRSPEADAARVGVCG